MKVSEVLLSVLCCIYGVHGESRGCHSGEYEHASVKGAKARVCVSVVSEEGIPISGVGVRIRFGMIDETLANTFSAITDGSGCIVTEGLTCGNYIKIVASCHGYYNSISNLCFVAMGHEAEVYGGYWMPKEHRVQLVLRKQLNPVALFSGGGAYSLPSTNEWYSFDLRQGDWMPPHGRGKVKDVEMRLEWSGDSPITWKEQCFSIRFPECPNGGNMVQMVKESTFPFSYSAITNIHCTSTFSRRITGYSEYRGLLNGDYDLTFRIRSVTNSVGEIVSCTYGRFRRVDFGVNRKSCGAVMLGYELNPNSLDANLERRK